MTQSAPAKRGRPPNPESPTRARLVAAAAKLFNEQGYFSTDTNKIAREAGFAPATFYKHFRDKKAVFLAAYSLWVAEDWEAIEAAVIPGRPPRQAAEDLTRRHLRRHARWVGFRRSMHALVASDEDARAFHLSVRSVQLDRMSGLLASYGAPGLSREQLLFSFLCVERALNAVTDGDVRQLKAGRRAFVRLIEDEIVFQLTGARD